MTVPIYAEDLGDLETTMCPKKSYRMYLNPETNTIDTSKIDNLSLAQNPTPCSDDFYSNEDTSGCCIIQNPADDSDPCNTDNTTGLKYDFGGDVYNICHKHPIQTLKDSLLDDPNKLKKFFKLIFVAIIILLGTAVVGCCYEFWLRYGSSIDCFYYKSKCTNIGSSEESGTPGEVSLINYMFPNSLCYYPYQKCSKESQMGGSKKAHKNNLKGGSITGEFKSNYLESKNTNNTTCITLDYGKDLKDEKPFPYNVADYAHNEMEYHTLKMPMKAFSFFFLYSVLLSRQFINWILTKLSKSFQYNVRTNATLNNIVFLFLSGLIFPILGAFLGTPLLAGGPMFILLSIIGFLGMTTLNPGFMVPISFILGIIPHLYFKKPLSKCDIPENYYNLFSWGLFYSVENAETKIQKFWNVIKNILMVPIIIFFILITMMTGMVGNVFAAIYMTFSLIFNFFYIPLSNGLEFFDILKSHADLLTMIFCIVIIGSSHASFNPTTRNILSAILAVLILYKTLSGAKKTT